MNFADLLLRLRHDLAGHSEAKIRALREDLQPFRQFCGEQRKSRVAATLTRLMEQLGAPRQTRETLAELDRTVAALERQVMAEGLGDVQPSFWHEAVTALTSLDNPGKVCFCAVGRRYALVREALLQILAQQCRLVENFSRTFRVQDAFAAEQAWIIGDRAFVRKVTANGLPLDRIIYMDFWRPRQHGFRKELIFPFRIGELAVFESLPH